MREREIKFLVPEGFALDEVDLGRQLRLTRAETVRFETVYWDTGDLRLAGWGCSLRHRDGEEWTLKLPPAGSGPLLEREEVRFAGQDAAAGPPEAALRLAAAFVRTAAVRSVARTRAVRHAYRMESMDGREQGVATLDEVRVLGRGSLSFREVEVELAQDAPASLADRVGKRFKAAGATPERTSKYQRALGGRAPAGPEVVIGEVGRGSTAGELARAAIGRSTSRLMLHDPLVRLGGDAEAVHQARVGVRRLRSNLRTFGPYLAPAWADGLRSDLRWVGRRLGALRDADVMLDRLRARIAATPGSAGWGEEVVGALEARRRRARRALVVALSAPRYLGLLDQLVAASRGPALSAGDAPRGRALAQALLVPPAGTLRTSVGRLGDDPPDAALHRVRIHAKGLRYSAEAAGPVSGRSVARVERAARLVQDVLGEHQDAVVAATWLRERAARAETPGAWKRLERAEATAAAEARAEWPEAWAKLERTMSEAGL